MARVKRAVVSDLQTRYQNNKIRELMKKASLFDPRIKSLVHLSEEEQTSTIDSLVNEIVTTFSPPTVVSEEVVAMDDLEQTSSSQINERSGDSGVPVRKKCMLEKLLGTTFSDNADTSVTVSYSELVIAELSRYKSQPILGLKRRPLEWWRNHEHLYPKLSQMARKYLGVVTTSVTSERLFSTAGNVVTSKRSALEPENVEKLVFLHDNLSTMS